MKKSASELTVIFVSVIACYIQVVRHDWTNWDDPWLVVHNKILNEPGLDTIGKIFTDFSYETRMTLGAEYLPVRDISIMIDKTLFGNNARGYLLVNLLIYLGALLALYFAVKKLRDDGFTPFATTLIFALHPVHVESVAWVASRKDVLCMLFFFLALFTFESYRIQKKTRFLIASMVMYVASLASKYPAIVFLGFVMMRLMWIRFYEGTRHNNKFYISAAVSYSVVTALFMTAVVKVGHTVAMTGYRIQGDVLHVLGTVLHIDSRYIVNLLFPLFLSPVYEISSVSDLEMVFAAAFSVFFIFVLVLLFVKSLRPSGKAFAEYLFWILWFPVALLPTSQLVTIQNKMTDRYLMFAVLALAFPLAVSIARIGNRTIRFGVLSAVALFFGVCTFRQVGYWKDSETLWERAVAVEPASTTAWYQLAVTKRDLGKFKEEGEALRHLLLLDSENRQGLNNYAIYLYQKENNPEEAAKIYEHLLKRDPKDSKALMNYGTILFESGRRDEGIRLLRVAIEIDPTYCKGVEHLAQAYRETGREELARRYSERAQQCISRP